MRRSWSRICLALALTSACGTTNRDDDVCRGVCDDADATGPGPYGPKPDASPPSLPPSTANWPPPRTGAQTCVLPELPPVSAMQVVEAYPALDFERPIFYTFAPGEPGRRYVVEQGGRVYAFEGRDDVAGAERFLELAVSRDNNEEGLLGLAFHPGYAENGRLFVYYSALREDGGHETVLSELRRDAARPTVADPASERVLLRIRHRYGNHKGGALVFGPDGFLYLGVGDGGSGGDPQDNAQNPNILLGKVLRLDIDRDDPECLTPYAWPDDNPFAGACPDAPGAEGRPEIFATGLRNPWRMSFDRDSGRLWAGDVGQDAWEEVTVVERAGNHGWRRVEGPDCFDRDDCALEDFVPPVFAYPRSDGKSITGGYVYRGERFPELWGAYVYGDYQSGRVWALRLEADGRTTNTLLAETGARITSFGEDPDGELFIVTFTNGRSLSRLARVAEAPDSPSFPRTLSATGCFADVPSHTLAATVVPYSLNAPFWSDGAEKTRAFALPVGAMPTVLPDGDLDLPAGTVTVKTFWIDAADGRRVPIETRLMVRRTVGWQGFSYRWRPDLSDADLLPGPVTQRYETATGPLDWAYPSRTACDECHTAAAGGALGLTLPQLNRAFDPSGAPLGVSQLEALSTAGWLTLPAAADTLPRMPSPSDPTVDLELRARAALDTNCAFCHRPDGGANSTLDLRFDTPLGATRACAEVPGQGELGLADARLIAPGDPERSVLLARMNRRGRAQMPPVASNRIDTASVQLIEDWIRSLSTCERPSP